MSTDNTESLRAAIETALRRRDPRATVQRSPTESDRSLWIAWWPRSEITTRGDDGYFGLDALRALALACGLRVEGTTVVDPAEEVERLRAALREHAPKCGECGEIATRCLDGHDGAEALRCDGCSPSPAAHGWCHELEHAPALRAARIEGASEVPKVEREGSEGSLCQKPQNRIRLFLLRHHTLTVRRTNDQSAHLG